MKSRCGTVHCLFDQLAEDAVRRQVPRDGLVATITETGNRDGLAARYLSRFGYDNVVGLQFGMRGWIKLNYPREMR